MTDQGFEILEHTADLRIKAWGKTKEELFKNALRGMAYVQKEEARIKKQESRITKKVQVKSTDMTALLIDFLSEVLTQRVFEKFLLGFSPSFYPQIRRVFQN